MKKITLAAALSTIITLSATSAHALDLLVVKNYDQSLSRDLWKKVKADQVPESLLSIETLDNPRLSYSGVFPKAFLQDEMFAVCFKDCTQNDAFKVQGNEIANVRELNWDVIEQTTVYYWMKKYFDFLNEQLEFEPRHYLKVTTTRDYFLEDGSKMQNNAFFDPSEVSLSFLPAKNSFFYKLMAGKISRSGFDPSVIAHESSHYLFHHLFPERLNNEVNGVNEGFADYVANIFLNNSKVGGVMLQGNPMRDSSSSVDKNGKPKIYKPNLPSHDLGERVALALWKTRELANNKRDFDRLVLDATLELGQNAYSTAHDFKEIMLKRIPSVVSELNMASVNTIWQFTFEGAAEKVTQLAFKNETIPSRPSIQIAQRSTENGKSSEVKLSILKTIKNSNNQKAVLISDPKENIEPHWIISDVNRGNILGIYDSKSNLLTSIEELKKIASVINTAQSFDSVQTQFKESLEDFSELSMSKGKFSLAYKVLGKSVVRGTTSFNGEMVNGSTIRVDVKKKAILGTLLGVPKLTSLELITISTSLPGYPRLDGQTVIGYRLLNNNSDSTAEIILERHPL